MSELRVGGLTRLSSVDWPGQLTATVFCRGCPWDCPYCHNHPLRRAGDGPTWAAVLGFLEKRRGLLDGVVFSGGEPTMQPGLPAALAAVRAMGFKTGLHSAGPLPERLAAVLPLLDWVGFDVKAPFDAYDGITRIPGSGSQAAASLAYLLESGVACEVRTTVHPALLDGPALARLAGQLAARGVAHYAVQTCRSEGARPGLPPMAALSEPAFPLSEIAGRFASFVCR